MESSPRDNLNDAAPLHPDTYVESPQLLGVTTSEGASEDAPVNNVPAENSPELQDWIKSLDIQTKPTETDQPEKGLPDKPLSKIDKNSNIPKNLGRISVSDMEVILGRISTDHSPATEDSAKEKREQYKKEREAINSAVAGITKDKTTVQTEKSVKESPKPKPEPKKEKTPTTAEFKKAEIINEHTKNIDVLRGLQFFLHSEQERDRLGAEKVSEYKSRQVETLKAIQKNQATDKKNGVKIPLYVKGGKYASVIFDNEMRLQKMKLTTIEYRIISTVSKHDKECMEITYYEATSNAAVYLIRRDELNVMSKLNFEQERATLVRTPT